MVMARIFFGTLKNRLIKDTHYATINLRGFHKSLNVAGDRQPRYGTGRVSCRKTPPFPVGRGPVPRHAAVYRTFAGDRPPRYGTVTFSSQISPTGPSLASRPGGRADRKTSSPGAAIETRRALLPGKRHRSGDHETLLTTTIYETP